MLNNAILHLAEKILVYKNHDTLLLHSELLEWLSTKVKAILDNRFCSSYNISGNWCGFLYQKLVQVFCCCKIVHRNFNILAICCFPSLIYLAIVMRLIIVCIVTFYCLYHHASGNQQTNPDDPNKPFWASRGRRSGKLSIKADDDFPEKWSDDYGMPEVFEKDTRNKQQATSFLAGLLNAIYSGDGDVVKKRNGDSKTPDPHNPFWAARG